MTHDLFGKLKYRERDEQWVGYVPLTRFAAVGSRGPVGPLTEEDARKAVADMTAAMENMKDLMRQQLGDKVDAAFEEWDKEAAAAADDPFAPVEELSPREVERERKREEREKKRAARLAKGQFPIGVGAMPGEEPGPKQEAAFRFLADNEQLVLDAVLDQVWESFEGAFGQAYWRTIAGIKPAANIEELKGRFALTRVEFTRESRGGFAHLVVHIDSDWQDEHGLAVVYSPDTKQAAWTSWDGIDDLTESDDPETQPAEFVPTPHDELLEAILTGDVATANDLVAAGADINALGDDEYPPLWVAADQMEVEEVRRLLAFGADPTLANEDERTTPLRHAKKLYKEMGFAPSKKKDGFMDAILSMAREVGGKQFEEMKQRLEEIIRLLEEAK